MTNQELGAAAVGTLHYWESIGMTPKECLHVLDMMLRSYITSLPAGSYYTPLCALIANTSALLPMEDKLKIPNGKF